MSAEQKRLEETHLQGIPWQKWGPYLSERQWGTVREDYSENGDAWNYFSHDQARSRAYHWGEDGLAGISDEHQLRLVNCGRGLNCVLAHLLLPASALLDSRQLHFENPTQAEILVLDTRVVALGEQGGHQLTTAELTLPSGQQILPAGQISVLPLLLHRSAIPPDHYSGHHLLACPSVQNQKSRSAWMRHGFWFTDKKQLQLQLAHGGPPDRSGT